MSKTEPQNEDKARSVLTHLGRPINYLEVFDSKEIDSLAAIYDDRIAPMQELKADFDAFWAVHNERLESLKTTVEESQQE